MVRANGFWSVVLNLQQKMRRCRIIQKLVRISRFQYNIFDTILNDGSYHDHGYLSSQLSTLTNGKMVVSDSASWLSKLSAFSNFPKFIQIFYSYIQFLILNYLHNVTLIPIIFTSVIYTQPRLTPIISYDKCTPSKMSRIYTQPRLTPIISQNKCTSSNMSIYFSHVFIITNQPLRG